MGEYLSMWNINITCMAVLNVSDDRCYGNVYRVSIVTCNTTLHKKCSMCISSDRFPAGPVDGTSNCCAHCTTACECTLCSVAHRNLLQLLRQLYTIALTSGWMVVHLIPSCHSCGLCACVMWPSWNTSAPCG